MQQTQVLVDGAAVEELRGNFAGDLIRDGDPGYDEARAVFNAMIDRRPAVIARCRGVADVVAAVNFARDKGLTISVKGGGHSVPGHAVCDDGVTIDLTPMKGVWIDPERKVARVQGGVTWGEFDRETAQFGLAVTGGRVPSTGVTGLTLGSGSGWLERKCGLTADNLISADVVTADGRFVRASEDEHEDLFWGLRGGSGNFGIVTSLEFKLHDVGPIVLGGLMAYPRPMAGDLVRTLRDVMADAPDDLCLNLAFITAPPEPFVPEEARGRPAVGLVVCWTGADMGEGERLIKPFRDMGPVLDIVGPIPYAQGVQRLIEPGNPPGRQNYWKADFLRELSDEAIDTLVTEVDKAGSPFSQVILEPLGGAVARVDEDAMALGNRKAPYAYHCIAMWEDPAEADTHVGWAKNLWAAMSKFAAPGVYLNYTSDQERDEQVRSTYGDKYARMVALKDAYDPDNLFHMNANIKPSNGA